MLNKIDPVIRKVYEGFGVHLELIAEDGSVKYYAKVGCTDSVRFIVWSKSGFYGAEVLPLNESKDPRVIKHTTLNPAFAIFELLHFYRDEAIMPAINTMFEAI